MLTVKPVYKLLNVFDDLKMGYKHTCDTIFTHFQGITNNIYDFGRRFFAIFFTRPNDGWTGLYIELCLVLLLALIIKQ